MSAATQQQAKNLSQQWWNSQASRINNANKSNDSQINLIRNTGSQYYQQQQDGFWNQYNRQQSDARWWAQQSDSINTNNQLRQNSQRIADKNTATLEADADRRQQMSLSRQQQFGDARTTGTFSVTNTKFDPNSTMQMRMFREQENAQRHREAGDYNRQVDMLNRQTSINSQATAQARAYESAERDKDRNASMFNTMWNSFSGAGQYGYRYW